MKNVRETAGVADAMAPLPVTVVIPVRGEATRLGRLLPMLDAFARVVVVESGPDAATAAVAARQGADFMIFEWPGGYPKKRTWAARHAGIETEWTMFLDADEEPSPGFIAELRRTLPATTHAGFWVRYDLVFLGRRLRHGVPQRKLALVRTGKGAYERIDDRHWTDLDMEVHEHLLVDGTVGTLGGRCVHREDKPVHDYCTRHADYAEWEARRYLELLAQGGASRRSLTFRQRVKYRLLKAWWFSAAYFVFAYGCRLGFLDGRRGLLYATLKAGYFAQVQAAILQQETKP